MTPYKYLTKYMADIAKLESSVALLSWDQEINMPLSASDFRADQIALLEGIIHEKKTSLELEKIFSKIDASTLDEKEQLNTTILQKEYEKSKKYSKNFIERMAIASVKGFMAWQNAKTENSFSIFAPLLKTIVELKQEESEILGYHTHPYQAHIEKYEESISMEEIELNFKLLKNEIPKLLAHIDQENAPSLQNILFHSFDVNAQKELAQHLLKSVHFDSKNGRLDLSMHPFSLGLYPKDVRLTTRINKNDLSEVIWSTLHEAGHGLYEQGLDTHQFGLPGGSYCSMSIHESQSRLWENHVGRSELYWKENFPILKKLFSTTLKNCDFSTFQKAYNAVVKTPIRTSSDELSYNLHIIIRYEIERDLIAGFIEVKDLPEVWNSKYQEYLQLTPKDDAQGVLQDVHWSQGLFGYFPTYSLGSIFAAQIFNTAENALPALKTNRTSATLLQLKEWLDAKVYKQGKLLNSQNLCTQITGSKLDAGFLMTYLKKKYN